MVEESLVVLDKEKDKLKEELIGQQLSHGRDDSVQHRPAGLKSV